MKAKYVGMCYIMACLLIGCGQMPMQQAHEGQTSAGDIVLQTDALTVTEGEIIERTVSSSVCEGDRNIKCDTNIYFRMEGTVEDYALYHEILMGNEPAYDTETDEYHTLEDCHYRAWENGMGQYSLGEEIFLHNMLGDETEELVDFSDVDYDIDDMEDDRLGKTNPLSASKTHWGEDSKYNDNGHLRKNKRNRCYESSWL